MIIQVCFHFVEPLCALQLTACEQLPMHHPTHRRIPLLPFLSSTTLSAGHRAAGPAGQGPEYLCHARARVVRVALPRAGQDWCVERLEWALFFLSTDKQEARYSILRGTIAQLIRNLSIHTLLRPLQQGMSNT